MYWYSVESSPRLQYRRPANPVYIQRNIDSFMTLGCIYHVKWGPHHHAFSACRSMADFSLAPANMLLKKAVAWISMNIISVTTAQELKNIIYCMFMYSLKLPVLSQKLFRHLGAHLNKPPEKLAQKFSSLMNPRRSGWWTSVPQMLNLPGRTAIIHHFCSWVAGSQHVAFSDPSLIWLSWDGIMNLPSPVHVTCLDALRWTDALLNWICNRQLRVPLRTLRTASGSTPTLMVARCC